MQNVFGTTDNPSKREIENTSRTKSVRFVPVITGSTGETGGGVVDTLCGFLPWDFLVSEATALPTVPQPQCILTNGKYSHFTSQNVVHFLLSRMPTFNN